MQSFCNTGDCGVTIVSSERVEQDAPHEEGRGWYEAGSRITGKSIKCSKPYVLLSRIVVDFPIL